MFCWERGAGPTQACGSGACAVTEAVLLGGFLSKGQWVAVHMPGGRVYICKDEDTDRMLLCGPGEFVYKGEIEI